MDSGWIYLAAALVTLLAALTATSTLDYFNQDTGWENRTMNIIISLTAALFWPVTILATITMIPLLIYKNQQDNAAQQNRETVRALYYASELVGEDDRALLIQQAQDLMTTSKR